MAAPQQLDPASDPGIAGERDILELIAKGGQLNEVLDALCRLIDGESGLMSSVYLLNRDGTQLSFAAGPRVPAAWIDMTRSVAATPLNGACGAAIDRRARVVVGDVATSPLYVVWRDAARESGIASVWSTPFLSTTGMPLGTFAMMSADRRDPDERKLRLVDRATHLASIAVERHRSDEDVRESEQRFSTAFYSSPASMTITRFADRKFLYVNDRFVSIFGYSRNEAIGQTAVTLGLYAEPGKQSALWHQIDRPGGAHNFETQARTKSGAIVDVLLWMERIQILGEACVMGIVCDITDRKHTEAALAESERLVRLVLETLPVGVAVVDRNGDIKLSNPATRQIWGTLIQSGGERYQKSRAWRLDGGAEVAGDGWASKRALQTGQSTINEAIEIEAFDGVRKVIQNSAVPIRDANGLITGAVIVNEDISQRVRAERELKESLSEMHALAGRLMRAQDEERRRIAQTLHETTAQDLAALKMHLARLTRIPEIPAADRAALEESIELANRSMSAVRTTSYLLHPPFLDDIGLLSAVKWYAAGFAERSGVAVSLDLPAELQRLPQDVETTLFRVVQEALINIHHHADSPTATISLRVGTAQLTLEVADQGKGMPPELAAEPPIGGALGVGVPGMRQRLQQLGGSLEIETSEHGTLVRARVPLPADPA